jgi:hypothetical protein
MTSPSTAVKIPVTPVAILVSDLALKTHLPKPYDIVQGMEHVIDMMEETLQICERAQRSTQIASRRKTFPFGLRPFSDVYTRQAAKSSQIQSGQQESSSDLMTELRARRDLLDVPCTYPKGTRHTLSGYRLQKKIVQERAAPCTVRAPTSPDGREFEKVRIHVSPTTRAPSYDGSWWCWRTNCQFSRRRIPRKHVRSKATPHGTPLRSRPLSRV